MFEYDKFYDCLFNDEKFLNIIRAFHSKSWEKMDLKNRQGIVNAFIKRYCEIFEIEDVKSHNIKGRNYAGVYHDLLSTVSVNKEGIKSGNQYDVMDTLFHELRHNFQNRAISGNLSDVEYASDEQIKEWKLNTLTSPMGYSNYIFPNDENGYLYLYQSIEEDAFKTGLACTKKAYSLIESKFGYDSAFVEYARQNMNNIMSLFSNESLYSEHRKKCHEQICRIFRDNNEKFEIEQKCVNIAKEIMKKDLKDMSLTEINALLSVYVWGYLEDDYKIEVLKEYDARVNKYEPVKIVKSGNSGIKIGKYLHERTDILNILNSMFTYQFKEKVNAIIQDKEYCDPKIKEDISINMYVHNDELVNFVEDGDNFLLYSIQPYGILEGKIILEQFNNIKKAENEIYGIEADDLDSMIDYYDYDKYIPYIEKFYGKSFRTIYNNQLRNMKDKIKELKRKTK